ncbi:zinc finger protein 182-like [Phymastichus coffea]|uniref:zinc finger protein 182-like n=1 Tax=Phymastichus coffea TaxID=108790 RepID=UPI00273B6E5C|nr:zinc finger protein 182-like [Phymastichus coffea]XP_058808041.1 zinc finger protein 182-like [Phymastichus coffea]
MEPEGSAGQVCRLCGQCVRMYIDIFGEEGVRRFLGVKIHSKINILINEKDLLPKIICVQCLGKLEFVCDFQEECLRTQQLLHDQYNVQPLSNIEENKSKDPLPSTSRIEKVIENKENDVDVNINDTLINSNVNISYNNNNISDKNLNPLEETNKAKASVKSVRTQRNLRRQLYQTKLASKHNSQRIVNDEIELASSQQPNIVSTRKLRSRQNTDTLATESNTKSIKSAFPEKKRLRNHNIVIDSSSYSRINSIISQDPKNKNQHLDNSNKIQIPTITLNKVLSVITNTPGVDVSVKEPLNRSGDTEDISFTVELSKKQEADSLTVVAKVFPDQGSCLVDKSIITFLEDRNNEEVNNLVKNIISSNISKDKHNSLIDKLQNVEDFCNNSRNPEELFKMDGEEIHVDENVEQININNQINYACKLCRKIYERKDKCTVHVKTHLGIKQYVCILCQAKFVCKSDVMKHIRCSHTNPRPISCSKCPKRFRSKFDLTEHMNVHKGIKPYQCADCEQSYHHKVSLQMHVKSHMPPQNLACEYCGKVFPYRTRLLSHIGSVHMKDRRNFRCRFCYNLYSSLSVLNEHIKTRHTTTYICETCQKTFKVASKYKAHILQHSNPKPFACSICKNKYASKAFLNEHLLKHQGVRKHICQKCGAAFAQASHLAAHRHVHEEKSHACPECGKLFNRRDNMKVHRKRHLSGEKQTKDRQNGCSDDENSIEMNEV